MAFSENALPHGWTTCTLRDVTLPVSKIDPKGDPSRRIDYIDISSIDNVRSVVDSAKNYRISDAPSRARQIVHEGDVLFATVRPYLRNIARVPNQYHQQIASTGFSVLRAAKGILPDFLFYKVIAHDFVDALSRVQYGVSYPAVKDDQVRDQLLFLPPTAEQRRIVAKIEELFSELDNGVAMLKAARVQLAIYRQAVLKHAFEGKLTTDRCERNRDVKPATSVPSEGKANHKMSATSLFADRSPIPDTWCWATVNQLLSEPLSNGRSVKTAQTGFPILRLTALRNGSVVLDEHKIGAWTADDAERFLIREGDFLVSRGNGSLKLVGIGSLVRWVKFPVAYPDTMIRCRLCEQVDREFFCFVWNSPIVRRQLEARARTTAGIFKVNQHDLEATSIPLPPRKEQSVIAALIQDQLATLDRTSVLIDDQLVKADTIRHSILDEGT